MRRHSAVIDSFKQQLARAICATVEDCSLAEAITPLGLDPADISRLRRGDLRQFSVARLLRLIVAQGYDVQVQLTPRPRPQVIRHQPAVNVTVLDALGNPVRR